MIEAHDIKKMVQGVVRRNRGLRDRRIMHPARDWFIGLGVMLLCVIAGGSYSAVLYVTYDTIDYSKTDIDQTLITYRSASVEAAIATYTVKKEAHDALVSNVLAAPDSTESSSIDSEDVFATSSVSVPDVPIEVNEETSIIEASVLVN